ncbi:MAG: hypothetical protein COT17_05830 [Elusimicrobia bacterium CG08_land_8_20_14_0_20_51_18]|nr:MAG: hypothetical protein COT17_05830 [Elusimicrobia bacterium CG08_land_8_20_14_0_20_51_18]
MRKIKKFRIPVYHYEIYRKGKKLKLDIDNSHLKGQEGLKEFVSTLASAIELSTLFDFVKNNSPLWPALRPENRQYASTFGVITLGETFTAKIDSVSDPLERELAKISAFIFLSTGINIISDLVNEEAKNDGFELLKPVYLYSNPPESTLERDAGEEQAAPAPELLSEIALRLEAEKIGIKTENGTVVPEYSAIYSIPWMTKKKK